MAIFPFNSYTQSKVLDMCLTKVDLGRSTESTYFAQTTPPSTSSRNKSGALEAWLQETPEGVSSQVSTSFEKLVQARG